VDTPLPPVAPASPWARIKEHKVLQWSLAYLGAALALAHGQELLAHSFHWPEFVGQVLIGALIVGFPIAAALAWYHGHRGMTRFSAPEMTVIALLLVIAAILLTALVRPPRERASVSGPVSGSGTEHSSAASVAPSAPGPVTETASTTAASVAVVPFANLTGDATKDYFSDGMAEELINALANVPGLKVASRISSFSYKGRNIDIRQIARDLGVATILEGSVRSAGERIRVTVQLINAQTGFHLWSQSYDRKYADIFKLQDDLASEIVAAFKTTTNAALPAFAAQRPATQDLGAYDLYLQAMAQIQTRQGAALPQALALFQQAVARDPKFALAWAWISITRAFSGQSPADVERDAKRALELDPSLKIANEGLALASAVRGQWIEADRNFRIALAAQNPAYPANSNYGVFVLLPVGHLHEALHEVLEGHREAPAFAPFAMLVSTTNAVLGRYSEAIRYDQMAKEVGGFSTPGGYIGAALDAGRYDEAARLALPSLPEAMRHGSGEQTIRRVFSAIGDPASRSEALRALGQLMKGLKPSDTSNDTKLVVATWYVQLGALDPAYALAEQAVDDAVRQGTLGQRWLVSLWTPQARAFRTDPRFQTFTTRLGFMDYWKQYGPPDECDLVDERLVCR
jgi:TolB-like protein